MVTISQSIILLGFLQTNSDAIDYCVGTTNGCHHEEAKVAPSKIEAGVAVEQTKS